MATPPQPPTKKLASYTAPQEFLDEIAAEGAIDAPDPFEAYHTRERVIAKREDDYHARGRQRVLSPERVDPFRAEGAGVTQGSSYPTVMQEAQIEREHQRVLQKVTALKKQGNVPTTTVESSGDLAMGRKRRWDMATPVPHALGTTTTSEGLLGDTDGLHTSRKSRWDATPLTSSVDRKQSRWDATPIATET
ncbi:U2 snRNP component prp10, partial [Dispira simplex]